MVFDYKKEYKEFYLQRDKPGIVTVPSMNFVAVRGKGNPNEENGEYQRALNLLYGIAFTIKMSKKSAHKIEGYSTTWYLRWRASGGRKGCATLTTRAKAHSSG